MAWYKRFGYRLNPFERDPFKTEYTLINSIHILEDLLYLVKTGSLSVIQGREGCGKTTVLRQVIDNFKGQGRVIYVDALKIGNSLDIEDLLKKKSSSLFSLLSPKKSKNMILLLDNVEYLSQSNCEKIKYYYDQNYIQSVVFATSNYADLKISLSLRDRILTNVFDIPQVNKFDALRIIRDRFGDALFLGDEAIMRIFTLSDSNLKFTLRNCEKICRFVVQEGRGEVLLKYVHMILKRKKVFISDSKNQHVSLQNSQETGVTTL